MIPSEGSVRGSLERSRGDRVHVQQDTPNDDHDNRVTPLSGTQLSQAAMAGFAGASDAWTFTTGYAAGGAFGQLSTYTNTQTNLADYYNDLVNEQGGPNASCIAQANRDCTLFITGSEQSGVSTFQQYASATLTLTYHLNGQGMPSGGSLPANETYSTSNSASKFCSCSQGYGGDPVNTSSGNYTESTTDISMPGRGVAASLTRTYNSLAAMSGSSGLFGPGWTSNLQSNVMTTSTGAVVTTEAGDQVTFTLVNGVYTPPTRDQATLTHNSDGSWAMVEYNPQRTLAFNAAGQLTSIKDLAGNTTTFVWSATAVTETDPGGRTIVVAISGGHATSETDPSGKLTYSYNATGELASVSDQLAHVTNYAYVEPAHLLTSTDVVNGVGQDQISTNVYDATGRVTSQTDPVGCCDPLRLHLDSGVDRGDRSDGCKDVGRVPIRAIGLGDRGLRHTVGGDNAVHV